MNDLFNHFPSVWSRHPQLEKKNKNNKLSRNKLKNKNKMKMKNKNKNKNENENNENINDDDELEINSKEDNVVHLSQGNQIMIKQLFNVLFTIYFDDNDKVICFKNGSKQVISIQNAVLKILAKPISFHLINNLDTNCNHVSNMIQTLGDLLNNYDNIAQRAGKILNCKEKKTDNYKTPYLDETQEILIMCFNCLRYFPKQTETLNVVNYICVKMAHIFNENDDQSSKIMSNIIRQTIILFQSDSSICTVKLNTVQYILLRDQSDLSFFCLFVSLVLPMFLTFWCPVCTCCHFGNKILVLILVFYVYFFLFRNILLNYDHC